MLLQIKGNGYYKLVQPSLLQIRAKLLQIRAFITNRGSYKISAQLHNLLQKVLNITSFIIKNYVRATNFKCSMYKTINEANVGTH